jgi:hypothetical protein
MWKEAIAAEKKRLTDSLVEQTASIEANKKRGLGALCAHLGYGRLRG